MNIEHYRNYIAIVETGSLTGAANKMHIAQSALSSMLKNMERSFGTTLILANRGIRKIELTDAGRILYEKARYICNLEELAYSEVADCADGGTGILRISLSPSTSISFIQDYLAGFSIKNPKVGYELYEVPIAEQTEQLLNGFTEIGIANAPLNKPDEFSVLFKLNENLAAVFALNNPWLSPLCDTVTLHELHGVPLCLSRGCSSLFKETCSKDHCTPNILSINTTKLACITWAKVGLGVAIVPVSFSEIFEADVCYKLINDSRLKVSETFVTVKGRALSPVAQRFLNYCSSI